MTPAKRKPVDLARKRRPRSERFASSPRGAR